MQVLKLNKKVVWVVVILLLSDGAAVCEGSADLALEMRGATAIDAADRGQSKPQNTSLTLSRRARQWQEAFWGAAGLHGIPLHPGRLLETDEGRETVMLELAMDLIAEDTGVPGANVDWHYRPPDGHSCPRDMK